MQTIAESYHIPTSGTNAPERGSASLPAPLPLPHDPLAPAPQTSSKDYDRHLVQMLVESQIYQQFEQSFSEATGLPLALRPVECWHAPLSGKKNESPFCQTLGSKSRSCGNCLEMQQAIAEEASESSCTKKCPMGLFDTAVPVRLGNRTIAHLQTGQIFLKAPNRTEFKKVAHLLESWNLDFDQDQLEASYFETKVIPKKQYDAMVAMLEVFSQYLSIISNQVALQQAHSEPGFILRAKTFIAEHYQDSISLNQVAHAVHSSSFYLCKQFKKITGLNFTEYVSRFRIEKAKELLLHPNSHISEVAYAVGFQSLPHFNRVFRNLVGKSPSEFRGSLPSVKRS